MKTILFFLIFCFLSWAEGEEFVPPQPAKSLMSEEGPEGPVPPSSETSLLEEEEDRELSYQSEEEGFSFENERISSIEGIRYNSVLEFGLEYPLNFGLHLKYLLTNSFYARLGLSFMPDFFLDSFESLSPSVGWLSEEEAKVIASAFENSMYIDFRLAWTPYLEESGGGPYIEAGVSRILYGKGELSGGQLSKIISQGRFDETARYSVKTNTYNVTAHIGYQIPFERIKLNIEVGLIKILLSHILSETSLTANQALNESQKKGFQKFLKQKGWIFPTVSGWIGFAF